MHDISSYQKRAEDWFQDLRDKICAEFELIENELTGTNSDKPAGAFERKKWQREGGGGGEMSIMRGRVFEKVGVNISTVHGEFPETMRKDMPHVGDNTHFWASGISLVAHMQSPLVPAVHMNTRMLVLGKGAWVRGGVLNDLPTPKRSSFGFAQAGDLAGEATRSVDGGSVSPKTDHWFGGGADLTPMFPDTKDTADFHAVFKKTCDAYSSDAYDKYKKWCDEYFYLKHRNEPRGVGGIFYDYLNENIEKDFVFTQDVGKAFLDIYPELIRRHMNKPWTKEQREHQLQKRGRYVEFNLLYDRGTRFGLMTGGNTEAILMSLPPEVTWP